MDWNYISGFFDADGSITLTTLNEGKNKTAVLAFHNCEKQLLIKIRDFILKETDIKGFITHKKPKKENHSDAYTLSYVYLPKVIGISKYMKSSHPKKSHRLDVIKLLKEKTKRNGKYTDEEAKERLKIEESFWLH